MVGAEDPVEQEFAFLLGLSPQRLAAVLAPEQATVQAAALRYAPAHLRSVYLGERSPAERSALAAALAAPRSLSKEHLLDVAATLRARAEEQAHLDAGETGDIDLAVELIEERPSAEQGEILEAMRRADPAKARIVQAALINDQSFERVSDELLAAAAMAVPTEVLARYLREAPEDRRDARTGRAAAFGRGGDPGRPVAGGGADTARIRRRAPRDVRGAAQGAARPRADRPRHWHLRPITKEPRTRWWRYEVAYFFGSLACGGGRRVHGRRAGWARRGQDRAVLIPIGQDALPQPKPLTASVLIVANLQRSSANLAEQYTSIITGLSAFLESVRLKVENIGLIASYADQFGPRLLLGQRPGTEPTNSQVLLAALARAADAGARDYNALLPFIGGSLGNVSNEDLPQNPAAAGVVGQLRR